MAFNTLSPSPFITRNGVQYNLQYDRNNGNVQIIQRNAPAGTRPIYQDGSWNSSATSLGLTESDKTQYHQQTIASVRGAYNTAGGVNSGARLPQWASQNFSNGTPGQTTLTPSNQPSSTAGGNSGGGLGQLAAALINPAEAIQNFASNGSAFGVGNENKVYGQNMTYPNDLLTTQQDYLTITQYVYRPSNREAIFGGTAAAVSILNSGVQRSSNLQSRVGGAVFLPMPNSINDSNNVSWGSDEMGNIAAGLAAQQMGNMKGTGAAGALGYLTGTVLGADGKSMAGKAMLAANLGSLIASGAGSKELTSLLGAEGVSKFLKLQGAGVETETILARGAGIVPNSNMELLFQSPTLRAFNFSYRLSPRSAAEAATVRKIIRFFKQGMAAKKLRGKSGQSSFFLGTPNVFRLEYKSGTRPIDGVNKIKTCALTSFSCNYTPDGLWAAYEQGQPVSTVFSMTFSELEPIYDTDYKSGTENIFPERDDLFSISNNSVGY